MAPRRDQLGRPSGPAAAALLAGGLGCATLGVMTVWAEASPEMAEALNWWPPAGPLTGKAGMATGVFLTSWLGLSLAWQHRDVSFRAAAISGSVLVAIGAAGTFPPVFRSVAERVRG